MNRPGVPEKSSSLALRVLAFIAIVVLLVGGVFVWGRVANTDRVAMLITSAWFVLVGGAAFKYARSRPPLRLPLAAGFVLVAVATGVLLGLPMLGDDAVNEDVVTVTDGDVPADAEASDAPRNEEASDAPRNIELARGSFVPLAHPGAGDATIIELANGGRKLTFTDFETDNGPDLRVYLTQRDPSQDGDIGEFIDLGALKGNVGNQQYDVAPELDLSDYRAVVVWCRAFAVGFTSATLD